MLATLVALACIQSKTRVVLQPVWSVGPDSRITYDWQTTLIGNPRTKVLRFMTPGTLGPNPEHVISELDLTNGEFKELNTVTGTMSHKPPLVSSEFLMFPTGEVANLVSQDSGGSLTILDPVTLEGKLAFKPGLIPADLDLAAKSILPQMDISLPTLGAGYVVWDSPMARIMMFQGKILRFKPGTWEIMDTLAQVHELLLTFSNLSLQISGEPGSGPFALSRRDEDLDPVCCLFDANWKRIPLLPHYNCYDAGPNGFLVAYRPEMVEQGRLECLNPVTGKDMWIRNDFFPKADKVLWDGDYVVSFLRRDMQSKSEPELLVLDGKTGETLLDGPPPNHLRKLVCVVGDLVLFETLRQICAYKIVPLTS